MSKIIKSNLPCLNPTCGSSDARQLYDNGTSFCFSCRSFFKKEEDSGQDVIPINIEETRLKPRQKDIQTSLLEIGSYQSRGFQERKISRKVNEFFDIRVSYNSDGKIDTHYYPYDDGKAYKKRVLPKQFTWVGNSSALFGMERFQKGGKRLVITEGEIDALSVAQAMYEKYQRIYPVVAMSSAAMDKSLIENRDWIRSFKEVVLCLDMDKAGTEATMKACKIVGADKARVVKLPHKDANDVLLNDGGETLMTCIFEAQPYVPSGIIGKDELWQALADYQEVPSHPYPDFLKGLNEKLKGKRLGEITLFVSGTGAGKSTLLREIGYHIKKTTDEDVKLGVVSLEESPAETARKFSGLALSRNPAFEELSLEDLKPGFDDVFEDDRVIVLDHQGAITDGSIVDKLEYMCLMGCKYILLDHITILVSEGAEDLRGNEAIDKVMNDLLRLIKRHPVWIGLISHLRKSPTGGKSFESGRMPSLDDIRGSGSIKQISFDIVAFTRNMEAENEEERNTVNMSVLKCRYTGLTGPSNSLFYKYDTGRMYDKQDYILDNVDKKEF